MDKRGKAALAAGAAAILLLGGAGSLAFWQDSTQSGGGTITAGELALSPCVPVGTTGWEDITGGTAEPIDVASFRIVPGDTLRYTCTTTVSADGDNLTATLAADTSQMFGAGSDPALRARLIDTSLTATSSSGAVLPNAQITEANDGQTVTVAARLTFDPTTPNQEAQNASVTLNNVAITLTQNTNPAP
ncbi:alternate-type signal peptide domain-containing protein [Nocardia asteroides]|uniref:alternate-type signal peptide domain-containing protein n=1 Tax=Nocardia asteroides TaxID=1824 RepID=UPI001E575DCA|nr:alternate-type signal peptide domain-containing protein [Nocardia asteroides]UGT62825.1 alternate-type signal peptide domain-containing protein [Nocardia asteroides]